MAGKKEVSWLRHKNVQTFGVDASVEMYETISTPGVDIRSKIACLIGMITVHIRTGTACASAFTQWRTQIAGGTQTSALAHADQKFVCEKQLYGASGAAGTQTPIPLPIEFAPEGLVPAYVVNPKLTILHLGDGIADLNSKVVTTFIDYVNVELDGDEYQAMMMAQMDLS